MTNTNKSKATKIRTRKPTAVSAERIVKAKTVKLGIDVHLDRYVVEQRGQSSLLTLIPVGLPPRNTQGRATQLGP